MCGIFGMVGRRDHSGLREAALTLRHRGPDGFGEWSSPDDLAYLAHCRLSIIDLSDAGRQPMANEDGSVQLTFNGEIYNFAELRAELLAAGHVFRSRTDTEVIVHGYEQWGAGVVTRLRGIFAFGLWDEREKRLLIARDRIGVKPVYYALRGAQIGFASEPRALLSAGIGSRRIEPSSMMQFLQRSYIHGSRSIWSGISRLPPASILVFDGASGVAKISKYWSTPMVDSAADLGRATEEAEAILGEAVREQLVADVPVGCFLSGGIDSSLICSFAAEHSPKISSYFADFAGWSGSERDDARIVADHVGTTHHIEEIETEDIDHDDAHSGAGVFDAFDEPIGDEALIPTWYLSRAIRRHVKVALSGDGGDELFAGYSRYERIHASPRRHLAWTVERLRRRVGVGRAWPEGCGDADEYYRFLMCPSFAAAELCALFPQWSGEVMALSQKREPKHFSTRDWQLLDLDTYLVDNNLARMDRGSMAHGLEVRVPILDHRLVELAFSLPEQFNSAANGGKMLLRTIAQARLPASILTKPKQGFSFPLERFISAGTMKNAVATGELVKSGIIDRSALKIWLNAANGTNHNLKLWLLYVLEQWARRWLFVIPKVAA